MWKSNFRRLTRSTNTLTHWLISPQASADKAAAAAKAKADQAAAAKQASAQKAKAAADKAAAAKKV